VDPDIQLLAGCPVGTDDRVLVSQVFSPALVVDVATRAVGVCAVHRRWSAVRDLSTTAAAARNVEVRPDVFPRAGDAFDVALVQITTGRGFARAALVTALRAVRPGGWLYAAGANRAGARTALSDAAYLGEAETVASKGGHRLFRVRRPDGELNVPADWDAPWLPRPLAVDVRGRTYDLRTQPGVFSWDHIDDGTRFLLDRFPELHPPRDSRVLDACCGYGILGMVAAAEWSPAAVTYADDDLLAVACVRAATTGRGVTAAEVTPADLTREVPGGGFDVILCNPPFHQGYDTDKTFAARFARRAARALRRGGRLILVANAFLPYRDVLRPHFADATQFARDGRYQILVARV
jgi:16S rRNA (guanine1207-N2)-methyltransferase